MTLHTPMTISSIGLFGVVALALLAIFGKLWAKSSLPYPPGPSADPLIGHARIIPLTHQPEWFHSLRNQYGNIFYLSALGKPIIVINSHAIATELLEKRGLIYCDRPRAVMFVEILRVTMFALTNYTKRCIKQRSLMTGLFTRTASKTYEPIQSRECHVLMGKLLTKPNDFALHIRRYATAIILEIAYGHRITRDDDHYITRADKLFSAMTNAGSPGSTPPDIFPILKYLPGWFPGAWWTRYGEQERPNIRGIIDFPFEDVLQQMAKGTAAPSFTQNLMENLQNAGPMNEEEVEDVKETAGVIYAAGAETTWSTINVFVLVMVIRPDIQKRAQEELDSVVGSNTLPTFNDRANLPFLECLLQEILRYYPTLPFGVPHAAREDDIFNNMFIPKGATVIANTYGINRDPAVYKNPEAFQPERFFPKPQGNGEPYPEPLFGYGRRKCPGKWMADASFWIAMAHTLAMFNIQPAFGTNGKPIMPDTELTSGGFTSAPKPFLCKISPRSEKSVQVIEQALAGL